MAQQVLFPVLSTRELIALNEMIIEKLLEAPELNTLNTFYGNINYAKKIGVVNAIRLVMKAEQGCNPTAVTHNLPVDTTKNWAPIGWQMEHKECWNDYVTTLGALQMTPGVEKYDITNTDIMKALMMRLEYAIRYNYIIHTWFGDTDAEHSDASPAGVITPGTDVDYFNLIDGFWKLAFAIGAGTPDQHISIASNSQATYALQRSALRAAPETAWNVFEDMIDRADPSIANPQIVSTSLLWNAAAKYVRDKSLAETYGNLVNGLPYMKVNGVDIIKVDIMDDIIKRYENNGTKYNLPARAILSEKDNLGVAVPGTAPITSIKVILNEETEEIKCRAKDAFDTKIIEDSKIIVAY